MVITNEDERNENSSGSSYRDLRNKKMSNQRIKVRDNTKYKQKRKQIQNMRILGIIGICLGGINSLFFIVGLVLIFSSILLNKQY